MTRWTYMVVEQSSSGGAWLPDEYGREGWEMVGVIRVTELVDRLWFKRRARQKKRRVTPRDQAEATKR